MWETIAEILREYGPFPGGIVVGIWLTKWAVSKQFRYMESDKKQLREENKQLRGFLESQQKRIDSLHEKLTTGK